MTYKEGDLVYRWDCNMPREVVLMSNEKKNWLGRRYFLTRFSITDGQGKIRVTGKVFVKDIVKLVEIK